MLHVWGRHFWREAETEMIQMKDSGPPIMCEQPSEVFQLGIAGRQLWCAAVAAT